MTKIVTMLMFGLLLFSVQSVSARESIGDVANFDTKYEHENIDNYDFNEPIDENSFYVSDEQVPESVKASDDINQIEEKTSFWQKVVNSSHFSSNTATRTWIPLNRVK